jgi:hypothetical protein
MIPYVLFVLFSIASAMPPLPTDDRWEFVECQKTRPCHGSDYTGEWDVVNIGTLQSKCGSLTYKVEDYESSVLQFTETCIQTQTQTPSRLSMYSRPTHVFGFLTFYTGLNEPRVLPGMIYYWKKNELVVAAFVRHPLLHATTEEFVRLWLKRGVGLTILDIHSIRREHARRL